MIYRVIFKRKTYSPEYFSDIEYLVNADNKPEAEVTATYVFRQEHKRGQYGKIEVEKARILQCTS